MIISASELTAMSEFADYSEDVLQKKLDAIEDLIRSYTNNKFQNRAIRFQGSSSGSQVFGGSPFLVIGDTVEISQSGVNDGLYVVTDIDDESVWLDESLHTVDYNLVTKIEYPSAVQSGVIDLMLWEVKNRQKVGIQSESLSRHSVTYFSQDATNSVMGYPISLLGFLRPYRKARF